MRKIAIPVLVALCGFALGAATVAKLNTYSYVPDAMNEPCGKTVFEWQLLEGRIDTTPVPLNQNFDLVRMEGEAKPQGLIVRAYLRPKNPSALPTPNTLAWNNLVGSLGSGAKRIAAKRFAVGAVQQCFLLTHIADRLVEVRGNGRSRPVAPDATREEQLAALAYIMSHAEPLAP